MRIFLTVSMIGILIAGSMFGQVGNDYESVDVPFLWGHSWPVGAKALGMGGAYSAIADKQAAILYNPAGLGRIKRTEVYGTFSQMSYSSQVASLGASSEEATSFTGLNDLGITLPVATVRGSLVFGFGYHRIRQLDTAIMLSRFARQFSAYDSVNVDFNNYNDGKLSNTSFGGSMEVAPDLFLGLSLNIWGGSRDYNNVYTIWDPDAYDSYYWSRFDSTDYSMTRFSGANFTLSMLYQIKDIASIAVVMKTPVTLKAKENWDEADFRHYEYYEPEDLTDVTVWEWEDSGYSEYKIKSPWIFRLGGALSKGPVTLSGDIELIDFSQVKYVTDTPYEDMDKAAANILIRRELRNIKNIYLGGEIAIPNAPIKLRGGYTIMENPIQRAEKDKRNVWSVGAGFAFSDQFSLDAAYAKTNWEGVTDDLISKEQINISKVLVSLSYRF